MCLDWISTVGSSLTNESHGLISLRIAQRIACSLQRENARAVLRRESSREDTDAVASPVAAVSSSSTRGGRAVGAGGLRPASLSTNLPTFRPTFKPNFWLIGGRLKAFKGVLKAFKGV